MSKLDDLTESWTRNAAQRRSRRGFLARLAGVLTATTAAPLLPIDRSGRANAAEPPTEVPTAAAPDAPSDDPSDCEYWRYCGIDGYLCNCCGGGPALCPPGTTASATAWVGTCMNPADGLTYLIAYNDCCGTGDCSRCECWRNEGQTPIYSPQRNNDIIWCFGAPTMLYNCSIARVIGRAG
jgi:methylamine dehydrogenase light chain